MNEFPGISRSEQLINPYLSTKCAYGLMLYNTKYPEHQLAIFEGWRSPARQAFLYSQGRTGAGKIVTHAQAWESWHQYGLAVDFARYSRADKAWTWDFDVTHLKICMTQQDISPGPPGDYGHFELTGGLSLPEAKSYQASTGILGLWAEITRRINL